MASDTNVIPATVSGSGPMFTRFPDEIYLEIFKVLLRISPGAKMGTVIDAKYFDYLNAMGPFYRLCRVSKHFKKLANVALYEANTFNFRRWNKGGFPYRWGTTLPHLPRMVLRSHLRHISITFTLRDYFFTASPYRTESVMTQIANVDQLMQHSVGARSIRDLTHAVFGFSNLKTLNLTIHQRFAFLHNVAATIAVIKAAKLCVRAKDTVMMDVICSCPRPHLLDWYYDLVHAIDVE